MIWHSSDIKSVLNELSVDESNGLPNGVAYERLEKFGKNEISENKTPGFFRRFLSQLNCKSVYALAVLSALCLSVNIIYEQGDYYSPLLIVAIIVINAFITGFQQHKCDTAFKLQKALTVPMVTVIREGIKRSIPSSELVIGDIILLNEGDYITADARLIETNGFRCNELIINGDVIPVEKHADVILEDIVPVAGRKNMVFSGCSVIHGSAKAVVVETGLNTELGKTTAINAQTGANISVIEKKLEHIGHITNIAVFFTCVAVFLISMAFGLFTNQPFASLTAKTLLNSVALGICAIPESMPFITTIVTALGVSRLIGDGIFIKNTSMLENLGKTTVLCADKTGVFTKNHMHVKYIYNGDGLTEISNGTPDSKSAVVLRLASACTMLDKDFTESAINDACLKYNLQSKDDINNIYPRLTSIPFDGERKMMTSINMIDGKPFAIVKGAPEAVLKKCENIDLQAFLKTCDELAGKALRLICIAIKALDENPTNPIPEEIECDLKFAGIICLEDPPRPEALYAIEQCNNAGIKVIMITGDNATTAAAVAREVGISASAEHVITGDELEELTDEQLTVKIGLYTVFARISPAQKFRIINALKNSGNIVTATGNDIDDADVLSIADVGFALGNTENDVAIGNSDIVVKKSSFSAVVNAIKECRGLFDNIKKAIHYIFSCNISEILVYLFGLLIFKSPIVSAVQLLWINLLTDSLPAVSLTLQSADDSVMKNLPSTVNGKLFDLNTVIKIAIESVIMAISAIISFVIGNTYEISVGYTMVFFTMALSQILHSFDLRSSASIIFTRLWNNEFMAFSSIIIAFICVFLCLTPAGYIFGFKILSAKQLLIAFLLATVIVPVSEVIKIIEKRGKKADLQ